MVLRGIKEKVPGCERIGTGKTDVHWYGLMGPLRGSEAGNDFHLLSTLLSLPLMSCSLGLICLCAAHKAWATDDVCASKAKALLASVFLRDACVVSTKDPTEWESAPPVVSFRPEKCPFENTQLAAEKMSGV